jgi:hypothetical protein
MDERTVQLIAECHRQKDSCLYTSTSLFLWLKSIRFWNRFFIVAPIILGGFAAWSVLKDSPDMAWIAAACAFLAGIFPAVYKALELDVHVAVLSKHAAEFKILQDRFRQAALVAAEGLYEDFKKEFDALMERMDVARTSSLTPPERYFKKAQEKIKSGDYDFSVDQSNNDTR